MQQVFQANGSIHIPVRNEPHITYWYNAVTRTFWMDVSATDKDQPIQLVTDSVKLVMLERLKKRIFCEKAFCSIT